MSAHSSIYAGANSHIVEVLGPDGSGGLQDVDGDVQTDAEVTLVTITDKRTGDPVSGVTFPITLSHIGSGVYRGTIPHGAVFSGNRQYEAQLTAVGSQGYRADWTERLIAKTRRA